MNILFNLLLFIIILGVIVFIHEFGHFTFAKLTGVYVYEFAIGMGPKLFSFKPKNSETEYSIRLVPIGGFCALAGENFEEDKKLVPKERLLQSKSAFKRFLIMFMGPGFNFLLAFVVLFSIALIWGAPNSTPLITGVEKNTPAYASGLSKGDLIEEVDGHNVKTLDDVSLFLTVADHEKPVSIKVKKTSGEEVTYDVLAKKIKNKKKTTYKYGIGLKSEKEYGIINAIGYTVVKSCSLFKQMFYTIGYLIIGKISISQLSGPVGIYTIVGEQAKSGISNLLYLMAYLSINVGFLNLMPLPAFDGGHILFIIIEKIKGSPVDAKLENKIHTVGLVLLMLLMVYVTFNDILRLF